VSIIERAAKLLGPIEQPNSKPLAPGEKSGVREADAIERAFGDRSEPAGFPEVAALASQLDAIERAVSERGERSGQIEPGEFAAQPKDQRHAANSDPESAPINGSNTRTLRINRDQLRRHGITTPDGARTPNVESFRRVKRQILATAAKAHSDPPANLVLVTSALPGEGKTFCAINLAISIALEINHTVLLVDADVANPSIPQVLGVEMGKGLIDVLLDPLTELGDVLWKTDIGKLSFVPAGTGHQHATELLASDAMRFLLREMAERYQDRIIIFDSPPLLVASEAGALASHTGQIIVVVEAGKTPEGALKAALNRIESSKITGLLLNKGQASGQGYGYGGYA
jgi:exopolysaccharide/PEP-CTERM locus tyrosine autokinase